MRIDLDPPGGGVVIEGTNAELRGLATDLNDCAFSAEMEEGATAEGSLLTDEGVETLRIVCTGIEDDDVA